MGSFNGGPSANGASPLCEAKAIPTAMPKARTTKVIASLLESLPTFWTFFAFEPPLLDLFLAITALAIAVVLCCFEETIDKVLD
jgi:hypothetical protein